MCNPEVRYFTHLIIYGQTDGQSDRTWCRADPTSSGSTKTFYTLIINQNIHTNLSYSIYFDIFSSDFFWYIFWSKIQHNIIWILKPNIWSFIFFQNFHFSQVFCSSPKSSKIRIFTHMVYIPAQLKWSVLRYFDIPLCKCYISFFTIISTGFFPCVFNGMTKSQQTEMYKLLARAIFKILSTCTFQAINLWKNFKNNITSIPQASLQLYVRPLTLQSFWLQSHI